MSEPEETAGYHLDHLVREAYENAKDFDWDLELEDVLEAVGQHAKRRVRGRISVALVAALIIIVFFVPFPHSSVFDRLSRQPNRNANVPIGKRIKPSNDSVSVLARLQNGLSFYSTPVLVDDGSEVIALLASNPGVCLRIAKIELSTGRVVVGGVASCRTAGLFKDASGQVFLLSLSGGTLSRFELWRVSDDLRLTLLGRLPYPERPASRQDSFVGPAVAVAPVPSENEVWIAVANHVLLMDLGNGRLLASWSGPSDNEGNITSLAMASSSGPLYATFCGPVIHNPPGCGQIVEIDPRTGSIEAVRHYQGIVWYGRYETVATPAGVWLSLGGGGNGIFLELFSKAGLQPVSNGGTDNLSGSLGSFDLMADGDVAWAAPSGALLCFSTSTSDKVRYARAFAGGVLGEGIRQPFGIDQKSDDVLLTDGLNEVIAVPIPKACAAEASAVSPKKPIDSTIQVLAQLPKKLYFDDSASSPVLVEGGKAVVAVVHPPLRLAEVQLTTGKISLGQRIAGIASLFTGAGGQVFLANVCL